MSIALREALLFYIDPVQSSAFGKYAQLAEDVLIPLLENRADMPMTVVVPNNKAFEGYIIQNGGNSSDLGTLTTPEWKIRWNAIFEYMFERLFVIRRIYLLTFIIFSGKVKLWLSILSRSHHLETGRCD